MLTNLFLLAQNNGGDAAAAAGGIFSFLCSCIFVLIGIFVPLIGLWKIFEKAGKPGWAVLIPIYNAVVLLEIIDRPIWWLILLCFGPVFGIIVGLELAKSFGKSMGFAIGMILLPFIFYPMLGFGDAKYQGPQHIF